MTLTTDQKRILTYFFALTKIINTTDKNWTHIKNTDHTCPKLIFKKTKQYVLKNDVVN